MHGYKTKAKVFSSAQDIGLHLSSKKISPKTMKVNSLFVTPYLGSTYFTAIGYFLGSHLNVLHRDHKHGFLNPPKEATTPIATRETYA